MTTKKLKLTLIKSKNGRLAKHLACLKGLGIKRMHQSVEVLDTKENRGMVDKVSYMLRVEEI